MFKILALAALFAVTTAHVIAPATPILTKTVHYETEPIITGHTETILKPKLEIPIVKTAIISEPSHVAVHEPTIARVGDIVESVPTAISHQSSTVVHSRAKIVTPIVAPAIKTHIAPVVKTYSAPVLTAPAPIFEETPILKTIEAPAPILKTVEETPILKTYESAPILKTFEETPLLKTYAAPAPLHYTHAAAPVLTKTVHYDSQPIVTGYSEEILKPKLDTSIFSSVPALAYAARPEFHYAAATPLGLSKEIRYSSEPIISGYSTEILKPKLESVDHGYPYAPNSAW